MMGKKSTQLFGAKLSIFNSDATSLISRETWFLVNIYNDIVDDDYNDEKYYE